MFYNFKIAVRNLQKNGLYSVINVVGLAVSLAVVIIIMLWVWDELSYDRFHKHVDDLYTTNTIINGIYWTSTPAPLALHAKAEFPEIVNACRIGELGQDIIEYEGVKFQHIEVLVADSTFFTMFDFPMVNGDYSRPFHNSLKLYPDEESMIISESKAKIIFGNKDPVGEIIKMGDRGYFHIIGIMKDFPKNSSIKADVVVPLAILQHNYLDKRMDDDWSGYNYNTYFQLAKGTDSYAFSGKITEMVRRISETDSGGGETSLRFMLQPIKDLHLYGPDGRPVGVEKVRLFAIVAVFILIIACINYVNLVTARAGKRNREMGLRKVFGAKRGNLVFQLMGETLLLLTAAFIVSIILAWLLLLFFNQLSGKEMGLQLFSGHTLAVYGVSLLGILTLAGIYPAIFLASFHPLKTVKAGISNNHSRHDWFRKMLVVIQFVCSVVLIILTIAVKQQLDFLRQKDLGYDKEYVFTVPTVMKYGSYETWKTELMKNHAITGVALSSGDNMIAPGSKGGVSWPGKCKDVTFNLVYATYDFIETMGIPLIAGNISPNADESYVLLNEEAVKAMELENPVGIRLTSGEKYLTVSGVVKDYNFEALNQPVRPLMIRCTNNLNILSYTYIRTTAARSKEAVEHTEKLWKEANPNDDFTYSFLDDNFDKLYRSDIRSGQLFSIFSVIAILISCLGLFGLVTYMVETKTKEIGIRKVLGASVSNIVNMLLKEFLLLVGISMLIAFPLAWYWMNKMLQDYAYHIEISWWMFALTGLITVVLVLLTIGWQAIKAATANPVDSIKTE